MDSLFHKPPSLRHTPNELKKSKDRTLSTFYKKLLCGDDSSISNFKIMLLYVSPEELNCDVDILSDLIKKIKSLGNPVKEDVYVAELSEDSSFYKEYKERFFR